MKALHRVVQGIFKAAGTFDDSRLTSRGGRCISFGHCAVNFLCGVRHVDNLAKGGGFCSERWGVL